MEGILFNNQEQFDTTILIKYQSGFMTDDRESYYHGQIFLI